MIFPLGTPSIHGHIHEICSRHRRMSASTSSFSSTRAFDTCPCFLKPTSLGFAHARVRLSRIALFRAAPSTPCAAVVHPILWFLLRRALFVALATRQASHHTTPHHPSIHPSTQDHHQGGCPFRCEWGCDVWTPRVARVLRHEKRRLRCGAPRRCFARCWRGRRRRPTTASCTCLCTTSRCVRSAARSSTTRSFRCTKDRWESSWTWSSCRMAT